MNPILFRTQLKLFGYFIYFMHRILSKGLQLQPNKFIVKNQRNQNHNKEQGQ